MTKKSDAPAIRFKGFSDAWEQRKLGDMMNVTSVKRIHQSDWTDSGVRFLRARDIVAAAKNEEPDDYLYISKEKYEEYSTLSGKVGVSDLLVTGVGTIGVPYLVRNLEPLYFKDGNIIWFQNSDKIDGKFLFYSFSAEQIQGFINESAGIGTVGTYTIESGKKTPISLPNQIEQAKVGEFFQQLDNLITLHQRKCALLFSPFQAFISMMFITSTFSWEQRKLSEITDKVTEKNAGLQYVETFTNSAEFGIISQRDFFDHDIAKLGSLDGYYIVKTEDFVYNPRISTSAPVGPINRNKLGRTGVMSPLYTVFRPHDIDTTYLEYFFKCGYWHSFMNFNGDSGARSDRFSIRDNVFFQMPIPIPDIDEQRKIGELLTCLDNLITLHQRKFEKLTNVKKSMLEKMFPQNGSSYPEIRFKGFTDPWEQRKFDEVFDCTVPNNTLSRAELSYDEGTVLNVHYGDVLIKYGSVLDVQKDDIPRIPHRCREDFNGALLQDGDVIIADTAEDETTGKACEIGNLQGSAIVSGLHTMVCRPRNRMALGYLGYYLNSNAYHHQLLPLMQGIKVLSLSRSNIQKTSVSYPIAVKEQQLIAYYFSQLDNLITLHQRQTIVYAVIRSIRKVILAERQYFAPPMVRKSP